MNSNSKEAAIKPIYDDGRYTVTNEMFSTPNKFYPIANTTGKIRRDPFWFALGATCLATASTFVYGDLLLLNELVAIWGIVGLSQIIGFKVGILSIDTIGHNNTMVFNSMPRIREIYKAILTARNLSHQSANFAISGEQTECN